MIEGPIPLHEDNLIVADLTTYRLLNDVSFTLPHISHINLLLYTTIAIPQSFPHGLGSTPLQANAMSNPLTTFNHPTTPRPTCSLIGKNYGNSNARNALLSSSGNYPITVYLLFTLSTGHFTLIQLAQGVTKHPKLFSTYLSHAPIPNKYGDISASHIPPTTSHNGSGFTPALFRSIHYCMIEIG